MKPGTVIEHKDPVTKREVRVSMHNILTMVKAGTMSFPTQPFSMSAEWNGLTGAAAHIAQALDKIGVNGISGTRSPQFEEYFTWPSDKYRLDVDNIQNPGKNGKFNFSDGI